MIKEVRAQANIGFGTTQQTSNPADLAAFTQQALAKGVTIKQDTGGYYMTAQVQPSAAAGVKSVRVDRALAEAILDALKTGGRISRPEVLQPIMARITDGGRYGDGEAVLVRLLLAACDDRKNVRLNDDRINITDAAETTFNHEIASFWGKLGAKARWGANDPGIEPKSGPVMQSGAGYGAI